MFQQPVQQPGCLRVPTEGESHQCTRFCQIVHVFGNMYQCTSSGQTHVCDQTCTQRVVYDNISTICRLSRRVFPLSAEDMIFRENRKRDSGDECHQASKRTSGSFSPAPQSPRFISAPNHENTAVNANTIGNLQGNNPFAQASSSSFGNGFAQVPVFGTASPLAVPNVFAQNQSLPGGNMDCSSPMC